MTYEEFLKWLFKIGTGWIGWTAHETRAAHMQEIVLAYDGHVDKLKAIHGSSEKTPSGKNNSGQPKPQKAANYDNLNSIFGTQ